MHTCHSLSLKSSKALYIGYDLHTLIFFLVRPVAFSREINICCPNLLFGIVETVLALNSESSVFCIFKWQCYKTASVAFVFLWNCLLADCLVESSKLNWKWTSGNFRTVTSAVENLTSLAEKYTSKLSKRKLMGCRKPWSKLQQIREDDSENCWRESKLSFTQRSLQQKEEEGEEKEKGEN